jgi:hypothetical protein
MQLHSYKENEFSNVDLFGVALSQYAGGQNHIAILFKPDFNASDVSLLHVGQHKGALLEQPSEKYLWLDFGSDFNPIRKQVILASIMQIAEVNKDSKIRYGLDHGLFCLDAETGRFNDNYSSVIGFTCATFVIEVFLSVGVKLIDWVTWPSGDTKDIEFQKKVLQYLDNTHKSDSSVVTLEYLLAQNKKVGKSRFLPQEIAAATQTSDPSKKIDIDPIALNIHNELTTYTRGIYTT